MFDPKWADPSHGLAFVAYCFSHFIQYQSVIGREGAKYGIAFESALRHWQIMIATLCFSSFVALAKRTVKNVVKNSFVEYGLLQIWFFANPCKNVPYLQSIGVSPW